MKTAFSPSRRRLLAGLGAAGLLAAGCGRTLSRATGLHAFHGETMGSTYTVKLFAPGLDAGGLAAAHEAVAAALQSVVARMSAFEPQSELSRFNRFASDAPFALSAATLRVLEVAQQVSRASDGAFDATVGRVVEAWGFGPGGARARPTQARLEEARRAVGWRALELDPAAGTASKERPAIALDLSGIAKGYGVDLAAAALEALGHSDYLVEVGGEVRTRGRNAEGAPWRLGIERPDPASRTVHRVVPLSGQSLATSGDYRIFFEESGRRYSHEMDPASGAPVAHALASVSVVAGDCVLADAWSTALFVAGAARGHALAVEHGLAAHFIERGPGGRLAERSTPAFAALGGWTA